MTTTVSNGTDTWEPTLVDGYESTRTSRTKVHQILGREAPDVTVRPATLRTGTLRLVFSYTTSSSAGVDSLACQEAHAEGGEFSVEFDGRAHLNMSYVPNGAIRLTLDPESRNLWILEVEYHEVP